jgi:hypothetical protein
MKAIRMMLRLPERHRIIVGSRLLTQNRFRVLARIY